MLSPREFREIKNRIRELNNEFYALGDPLVHMEEVQRIRVELEPLEDRFDVIETERLERKASRMCIEIPRDKEGWWRSVDTARVTDGQLSIVVSVLTSPGQRGVRKLIREERIRTTKRWFDLLVPILALIVAILALIR